MGDMRPDTPAPFRSLVAEYSCARLFVHSCESPHWDGIDGATLGARPRSVRVRGSRGFCSLRLGVDVVGSRVRVAEPAAAVHRHCVHAWRRGELVPGHVTPNVKTSLLVTAVVRPRGVTRVVDELGRACPGATDGVHWRLRHAALSTPAVRPGVVDQPTHEYRQGDTGDQAIQARVPLDRPRSTVNPWCSCSCRRLRRRRRRRRHYRRCQLCLLADHHLRRQPTAGRLRRASAGIVDDQS